MNRFVERFAPSQVVQGNETYGKIYTVQSGEIERLHGAIKSVVDNSSASSIDEKGIEKWERLYNLAPDESLDTESRKLRITVKRGLRPPFTETALRRFLTALWGEGNFTFEVIPNDFEVIIDVFSENPKMQLSFMDTIRGIIPANMDITFGIQYTYLYLRRYYTYGGMEGLTYGELSKNAYIKDFNSLNH